MVGSNNILALQQIGVLATDVNGHIAKNYYLIIIMVMALNTEADGSS